MSLVGWWPLHEQNGRANDLSGNGNHGTLLNNPVQGVWGRGGLTAYGLDGNDEYLQLPKYDISNQSFTVSFWVKAAFESAGNFVTDWDGSTYNFNFYFSDTSPYFIQFKRWDGTNVDNAEIDDVPADAWLHIVGVYDGNQLKAYHNGEVAAVTNDPTTSFTNTSDILVGWDDMGDDSYQDATYQDVRIYDRALSPREIQHLYEMASGDYTRKSLHNGTDSGAVSRYKFDSGSLTADSWGSNNLSDNTSAGTTTDSIQGEAKLFDGSNDYMEADTTFAGGQSAFTVSSWVKADSLGSNTFQIVNGYETENDQTVYQIKWNGGSWGFDVLDSSGSFVRVDSNSGGSTDSWYHVVGVYDGDSKIYLNGVLDNITEGDGNTVDSRNDNIVIGRNKNSTSQYWNGTIDEVRLYNRALSASEVMQLYRQNHGKNMRKQLVNKR